MKTEGAPRTNGLGVAFFKRFWETIKEDYVNMLKDFKQGCLDIKRLNYGVIT